MKGPWWVSFILLSEWRRCDVMLYRESLDLDEFNGHVYHNEETIASTPLKIKSATNALRLRHITNDTFKISDHRTIKTIFQTRRSLSLFLVTKWDEEALEDPFSLIKVFWN